MIPERLLELDPVNFSGGNGNAATHDGFIGVDTRACAIDRDLIIFQDTLIPARRKIRTIDDIVVIALGSDAEYNVIAALHNLQHFAREGDQISIVGIRIPGHGLVIQLCVNLGLGCVVCEQSLLSGLEAVPYIRATIYVFII